MTLRSKSADNIGNILKRLDGKERPQLGHPQLRTGRVRRPVGCVESSEAAHHDRRDRGADRENGARPDRGDRHPHVRATASVHVREAVAGGTGFLWEINGTDGTLRITAAAAQPQIFPLTVAGAKGRKEAAELAVPAALIQTWPALASLEGAPADNVGRAYAAFAADMANGTHTVPDFADAVRRHEVIAAIESSASSGERVKA